MPNGDDLNNRRSNLVQALQVRWAYDSSNVALKDLFTTTGELEGVPVKDWAVFSQEKGGLAGSMQFAPLEVIASTYSNLISARDKVKAQIYEIEWMSDIQRAAATPYETKASLNSSGFSQRPTVASYAAIAASRAVIVFAGVRDTLPEPSDGFTEPTGRAAGCVGTCGVMCCG